MKEIKLTPSLLKPFFSGQRVFNGKKEAEQKYHELKVHANGEYPFKLIDERRPNESKRVKQYRHAIYEPITRDPIQRVSASLTKIRRSRDWNVEYPEEAFPDSIPPHERLRFYATKKLPYFENIENWLFSICKKNYELDANAIVLWKPKETKVEESEYLKPIPIIYHSDKVLEYRPGELLIVELDWHDVKANEDAGGRSRSKEFLAANSQVIEKWRADSDGGYSRVESYAHKLGYLPAFKLGGQYFKSISDSIIMESRLSPMLPRLNDAAREYSDLQAEIVMHIHSEKWVYASEKCPTCSKNGVSTGFINRTGTNERMTCPTCKGRLRIASSPFENILVRPANKNLGEQDAPTPPAGYITKPIDIAKLQDERIDKHLFKALAAINFQFLDHTPLNSSGRAKEVDRDELNNFVYSIAEDLVRILENSIQIIADYRYRIVIPDESERMKLVPSIKVPEKFDLLSADYLIDELKKTKEAGANPIIVSAMEREFASKKFYAEPKIRDSITMVLELDPLQGISDEEKMIRLSNRGISRLDYVISSNINQLIKAEIEGNPDFMNEDLQKKKQAIEKRAQMILSQIDSARIQIGESE